MILPTVEQSVLRGNQRPRIYHIPEYASSTGDEAIELAEMAGLVLDEWQQWVLRHSLGERPDGKWAAREVGLMVSRQNGKGALLEARELAGLFLLEEPVIIHSAHQFDTAASHFARLSKRIEDTPEFSRRLGRGGIKRGHGNESIALLPKNGRAPEIVFRTRTGSGGLGFSINCLVFDEAMIISEAMHQALLPTLSAQPNIQVWYTGSAVDQENPSHDGVAFARIREKGIKGSRSLAYFEWSLKVGDTEEEQNPNKAGVTAEEQWAEVNPGLGIRISSEYIREVELDSLSSRGFAVQRLGVGDWPRTDGLEGVVIAPEAWAALTDPKSKKTGTVCFAGDVSPDRSKGAIAVAGYRSDGLVHVELIEHRRGTGWMIDRFAELTKAHDCTPVPVDGSGPIANLIEGLEDAGVDVAPVNAKEQAQACGNFYDGVDQKLIRHIGQLEIADAIRGAVKRSLSDAWAWSRKNSSIDISPLVAVTLAYWGVVTLTPEGTPEVVDLNAVLKGMRDRGEQV